jgi:hypothetical protein
MSQKDTIAKLRLALAGAVGTLEACEQIMRTTNKPRTAEFCVERITEYTVILAESKPNKPKPFNPASPFRQP